LIYRIALGALVCLIILVAAIRPLLRRKAVSPIPQDFERVINDPRFIGEVEDYFNKRNLSVHIEGGVAHAPKYIDGHEHRFGLRNLAQKCTALPASDWAAAVNAHFEQIDAVAGEQTKLLSDIAHLESVKNRLAIQIMNAADVPVEQSVHREDLPGTVSILIFDLPKSSRWVTPDEARAWGRPQEELFAIAIENQRAKPRPQANQIQAEPIGSFIAVEGPELTTATYALMLGEFNKFRGSRGALVTIPTSRHLFCLPLDDRNVGRAAQLLVISSRQFFLEGPASITDRVFWFHDGKFEEVSTAGSEAQLRFVGPGPLRDILSVDVLK
jgi:hypothetical protein